jgi:hypothetical protein
LGWGDRRIDTFQSPRISHQRAHASEQASDFAAERFLQHLFGEALVGHHLAQLVVLILELLQPPHLGRRQTVLPLLPVEVGRPTDPGLAAEVRHRHSLNALLEGTPLGV